MKFLLSAAGLAAILAAAPALAQTAAPSKPLTSTDQQFINKAAQGNTAEVSLGKMAMQKSTNPAVQEFGRWMETDHTLANKQLIAAARAANAQTPPTQPNAEQQSEAQSLQKLSGEQFDQKYIQHMVTDHQKDVQEYQNEANNTQNRYIKGYAEGMLPVIKAHLAEAQQLSATNLASAAPVSGSTGTGLPPAK